MNEIWKDIAGYEGLYQVSNMGRVKSLQSTKMHDRVKTEGIYVLVYIKIRNLNIFRSTGWLHLPF